MEAILVANLKGGCGKTTVATHVAAALARGGFATALADLDRQRAALSWTSRRPETAAAVAGIDWAKAIGRRPDHVERLVIDAPAGFKGRELDEAVALAGTIVVPVVPGVFDEDGTRRFLGKLAEIKPVAKGRRSVLVVGNRVKARTRTTSRLADFVAELGQELVCRVRDSQLYGQAAAQGLTVFELDGPRAIEQARDWSGLLTQLGVGG